MPASERKKKVRESITNPNEVVPCRRDISLEFSPPSTQFSVPTHSSDMTLTPSQLGTFSKLHRFTSTTEMLPKPLPRQRSWKDASTTSGDQNWPAGSYLFSFTWFHFSEHTRVLTGLRHLTWGLSPPPPLSVYRASSKDVHCPRAALLVRTSHENDDSKTSNTLCKQKGPSTAQTNLWTAISVHTTAEKSKRKGDAASSGRNLRNLV